MCGGIKSLFGPAPVQLKRGNSDGGSARVLQPSDLFVHGREIKVIPCFDDFPICYADNCDSGEVDWLLSRSYPESVSFMLTANGATSRDFVTFRHQVFNYDLHVWECLTKHHIEGSVIPWSRNWLGRILRQTV